MTVRPLRDGRYVVERGGGTYVVDLDGRTCTCPDHAIRGAHCKHLRRVAIEVTEERIPAPDRRTSACAVCGERLFVPRYDPGPSLCERHDHEPGDVVRDRENGRHLAVVSAADGRADATRTDEGNLVSEYPTNAAYGGHEPVFEAVYVESLSPDDDVSDEKRYSFPASRLAPANDAVGPTLDAASPAPHGTTRQSRLPSEGAL